MIYVLYHDYSDCLPPASDGTRVARTRMYGPFMARTVADEWSKANLMNDADHVVKQVDIKALGGI